MLNSALFRSERNNWPTPWEFFIKLNDEFDFTLDVCALPENAKCSRYFTPEINGLSVPWIGERCFMNPPYGREIGAWVTKAHNESERGALVVGLLPARTDTVWFHEHVYHAAEIRFLRGRIKFEGATSSAPFPSIIAVWGKACTGVRE